MLKVKRALISVSDKKGIVPFARSLYHLGVEIVSTGGTARSLQEANIPVIEVSDYTGFPEMLDGRVKTLHPKIHAGLLALRDNKEHMEKIAEHAIGLIDIVVINLYPFEGVIQKKNVSLEEAIENIDIGGPAMLRSAAKNYKNVAVVCNPEKYDDVLKELDVNSGLLSDSVLFKLAVEAFRHTARYDGIISQFLNARLRGEEEFNSMPREIALKFSKIQDLRYGENPHQEAAFYKDMDAKPSGLASLKQHHGKELSFNNLLDLHAAVDFVRVFSKPAAVIIKHNNPTGVAQDIQMDKAYRQAWECDSISAFGGIIGLNRKVDEKTADLINKSGFMECVIAPGFSKKSFEILKGKKNLRLLEVDFKSLEEDAFDIKKVYGGMLIQQKDKLDPLPKDWKTATKRKPTKQEFESFNFGWQIIKNIKSNAVILVKGNKSVGIGCGQTSRVESVKIAIEKAGKNAKGSVMVSDGFFPKIDNIQLAAKAGIKAVIQPGGSIADEDVIKACDKAKMAMVLTGVRHFKH